MITSALFLFYFLTPLLILNLCHKSKSLNKIGAVILVCLIGIILGNIVIIPCGSSAFRNLLTDRIFIQKNEALELFQQGVIRKNDLVLNQIGTFQDLMMSIVIPLSIPLLLFSLDLKNSPKILKKGFFSILIAISTSIICIFVGYLMFKDSIPEAWKISGLLTGLYSGGTTSLATLSSTLHIKPNLFFLIQTFHFTIGALMLLLFISPLKQIFKSILPHFNESAKQNEINDLMKDGEDPENLSNHYNLKTILPLAGAFCISVIIFVVSAVVCMRLPSDYQTAALILMISTFGILLGFIPRINKIEKTHDLGMYFILVFCLNISSMVDFRTIFQLELLNLFLYMVCAVFGSILLLVIFSTLFRIESEITIVTITALLIPLPFIPTVATALKKKEIVANGITISVFGYAIGNFLAIFFAYLLKYFS